MSTYAFAATRSDRLHLHAGGSRPSGRARSAARRVARRSIRPFTEFGSVRADGDRVVFRAGAPDHPASIVMLDLGSGRHDRAASKAPTFSSAPISHLADYLTKAESVEFPTTDGETAFGLFYPPHNPDYAGPAGERPPLLVKCHGGPTAAASSTLNLRHSVLDQPRHRRARRELRRQHRLRPRLSRPPAPGNWGIVDVDDCVNGARFLAERRAWSTASAASSPAAAPAATPRWRR